MENSEEEEEEEEERTIDGEKEKRRVGDAAWYAEYGIWGVVARSSVTRRDEVRRIEAIGI